MWEWRGELGLNSQSLGAAIRAGAWRPGDIAAGLTLAIAAVPEGMASALVAGVAPAYGLYAVIAGGAVGSLLTSTAMMSIGATAALSVSAGQAIAGFSGEQQVAALAILAILTGGFQLLLGALNLGFLTRFISNAVMTGFLAGVGVSIVLSQLSDFTGYEASGRSTIAKVRDLLAHLDQGGAGSTFLKVLANSQQRLQANEARLFLSGIGPDLMAQLERTGLLDLLGADAVFPMEAAIGASTRAAREAAQRWVEQQSPPRA